jgi:hypothetical protein
MRFFQTLNSAFRARRRHAARRSAKHRSPRIEQLESRMMLSAVPSISSLLASAVRPIDGVGNNRAHKAWGSAMTD